MLTLPRSPLRPAALARGVAVAACVLVSTSLNAEEPAPAPPAAEAQPGGASASTTGTDTASRQPRLGFEPEDFAASTSTAESLSGVWALVVKATVALAAVILLIYLVLGRGLAKLSGLQSGGRALRVVDRVGLESRKTLYLVEVDGVRTLVATSDHHLAMMVLPEQARDAAGPAASSERAVVTAPAAGTVAETEARS